MAYVPGFDYDLFVSYASVDNDLIPSADVGWVDTLVRILTSGAGLAGKLGRRDAFTYWIDKQSLRGNHEVNSHIPEQVKRSALLIVILSPGYLASKFCRLELQAFEETAGGVDGRIFVVNREPVVEKKRIKLPDSVRTLRKYQFWELDRNNKPRILGWPQPIASNADDRSYYQMIGDVCQEIADKLEEMKIARTTEAATPAPVKRHDRDHPAQARRPAVLLAETTDDLLRKRDEVRRYLDQAGIDVLPTRTYYGLTPSDYETALTADLANAAAFVQLLGPEPGRTFEDLPNGFGWLQYTVAMRAAKPILRWRNPALTDFAAVDDPRHRELLTGADAMPIEDFKDKVRTCVFAPPVETSKKAPYYFINCDSVDMEEADAIGQRLGGVDWERPAFEDKPRAKALQQATEASLTSCDGLLFVHGRSPPSWLRAQLQLYRKVRPRRSREPSVLAVVQAGPAATLKGVGVAGLRFVESKNLQTILRK